MKRGIRLFIEARIKEVQQKREELPRGDNAPQVDCWLKGQIMAYENVLAKLEIIIPSVRTT